MDAGNPFWGTRPLVLRAVALRAVDLRAPNQQPLNYRQAHLLQYPRSLAQAVKALLPQPRELPSQDLLLLVRRPFLLLVRRPFLPVGVLLLPAVVPLVH